MIDGLEELLAQGKDSPELRFGLASAYLKAGQPAEAAKHFQVCIDQRPDYTAAWKLLARSLHQQDLPERALKAYRLGIAVAEKQGDKQAQKEMEVFVRRLQKELGAGGN